MEAILFFLVVISPAEMPKQLLGVVLVITQLVDRVVGVVTVMGQAALEQPVKDSKVVLLVTLRVGILLVEEEALGLLAVMLLAVEHLGLAEQD